MSPLLEKALLSLLKLGNLAEKIQDTSEISELLNNHFASGFPLIEAYQNSYVETLEAIIAALSPNWKDAFKAKRKTEFTAQVANYYLLEFCESQKLQGEALQTFKGKVTQQCQALLKYKKQLFPEDTPHPLTESTLATLLTTPNLPTLTQLILERLQAIYVRKFFARIDEQAVAFLRHHDLLGHGMEFFLRNNEDIATRLQALQTAGLWNILYNLQGEITALRQAGVADRIQVEDEFKNYDSDSRQRIGKAVSLLRSRALKPNEHCHALLMAGSASFSLGEVPEAKRLLEEALQLAQNDAERALAHYNLFQVYLREGSPTYNDTAFYHLQTAIALDTQYGFYEARKYKLLRLLGAGGNGLRIFSRRFVAATSSGIEMVLASGH